MRELQLFISLLVHFWVYFFFFCGVKLQFRMFDESVHTILSLFNCFFKMDFRLFKCRGFKCGGLRLVWSVFREVFGCFEVMSGLIVVSAAVECDWASPGVDCAGLVARRTRLLNTTIGTGYRLTADIYKIEMVIIRMYAAGLFYFISWWVFGVEVLNWIINLVCTIPNLIKSNLLYKNISLND